MSWSITLRSSWKTTMDTLLGLIKEITSKLCSRLDLLMIRNCKWQWVEFLNIKFYQGLYSGEILKDGESSTRKLDIYSLLCYHLGLRILRRSWECQQHRQITQVNRKESNYDIYLISNLSFNQWLTILKPINSILFD